MSEIKFNLSTVTRNSVGGWTVRYPVRNEPRNGIVFGEKHFDGNRKGDALGYAKEKEEAYYNADSDALESIEHTFNTILQIMHDPERYVLLAAQINFLADQIRDYQGDSGDIWYIGKRRVHHWNFHPSGILALFALA
jgi:hypothetical protein